MKNIFRKLWQAMVLGLGISFWLASPALAANLTYSAGSTIALTSPAINITIVALSAATTLVVKADSFVVTVPAAGSFTVTSATRNLGISGQSGNVYSLSCSSGVATLVISPTAGAAEVITVTPTASQCVDTSTNAGNTGSNTGGGGSPASTAPVITSFTASSTSITAGQSSTLSWNVSNASTLSVNQGVGTLPSTATGTKSVSPTVTTTYTLTATNSAGQSVTAAATVTIAGTVPATPAVPNPGLGLPATSAVPGTPAPPGAHFNGTLILDGSTIYLIKDGQKLGFRNQDEYKSHGYSFGQAVAANAQDKAMPQAEFVEKALEGTLVLDASDGKTVYMIGVNGTKRGFASAAVFKALGYVFGNLPKINLADYPAGPAITDENLPHPEGALVLDGKTVWWILNNTKQGFESMAVFNTYGFSTSKIVKANAADLALLQGQLVKFRDGTLVKDGGTYYLISDGKKLSFVSAADLAVRGYKTANAISASLVNYDSGGAVQ